MAGGKGQAEDCPAHVHLLQIMTTKILIIEDEPAIAEVLEYNLGLEGYQTRVEERGDQGIKALREFGPDLVLLDLMLPGIDGLDVLRALRRDGDTAAVPVVVLTAKSEEVDRIVGLELGADDYIPKPFSPREVVLRVKAILRRTQLEAPGDGGVLHAGTIQLDPESHRMTLDGVETALTATEFKLLHMLMERHRAVQTRDTLLADVWGYPGDVDSRTVDTHVRRLRKKLGREAERIETVIGVGYRFRRGDAESD